MTSMTRHRRRLDRWAHFADKVAPGWRRHSPVGAGVEEKATYRALPVVAPSGLKRAWLRHDAEQLRRNVLLFERARIEANRGA